MEEVSEEVTETLLNFINLLNDLTMNERKAVKEMCGVSISALLQGKSELDDEDELLVAIYVVLQQRENSDYTPSQAGNKTFKEIAAALGLDAEVFPKE